YPRPSLMSSMYLYCDFQSSEEFSALETSSIAISFLRALNRSTDAAAAALAPAALGVVAASAVALRAIGAAVAMAATATALIHLRELLMAGGASVNSKTD